MYVPRDTRESRPEVIAAFIRAHPFGMLVSNGPDGPQIGHVSMLLEEGGEHGMLRGHLARANDQWKSLEGARVVAVFNGPEHYISPSWYPSKREHGKVVPTWNYAAVQVRGIARAIEDRDWLAAFVRRLTDAHEREFAQPWSVDDAPADYLENMFRAIVGFEIAIDSIDAKFKLGQGRSLADRQGVVAGLQSSANGDELRALTAGTMQQM